MRSEKLIKIGAKVVRHGRYVTSTKPASEFLDDLMA
jgi:hypothetical protein